MSISILDLFTIGIGPSSSHTVGPMRAAKLFAEQLVTRQLQDEVRHLRIELYGSLGATGKGHGTDKAILLGLLGLTPDKVDVERIPQYLQDITEQQQIKLLEQHVIPFHPLQDIAFLRGKRLPKHANGMWMMAFDGQDVLLHERTYYSIGGGFIVEDGVLASTEVMPTAAVPFPVVSAQQLLLDASNQGMTIAQLMRSNERTWRSDAQLQQALHERHQAMANCIARGLQQEGILPGGLKVKRRAAGLYQQLQERTKQGLGQQLDVLDWVSLYAIAVNEENAAGGRVVTAPTNGAAGIIPAVLQYYTHHIEHANAIGVEDFLLTAGAIGLLFKRNASISGAEVGCQGEVGVACSMAAAGLTAVLGGTLQQIENAAEIAMEHHLGLTCDPIGGLVQIPCIERNAVGTIKAIHAARLALLGNGEHRVSLDKVIKTMYQTGLDMKIKYKETSRGGLALNMVEC